MSFLCNGSEDFELASIIADYLNKSYLSPTYLNKKSTEKLVLIKSVVDLDSTIFWLKLIPFPLFLIVK
jgi:hypothetical protein